MTLRHYIITLLLTLQTILCGYGQGRISVALYDVGRLYDTTPSARYNDSDYTPTGRMQWSEERYRRKIEHITEVIDALKMPLVVLYGVENIDVVRDIQECSQLDYSAIHRSLDYYTGLDFALLYYGDMFDVESVYNSLYYTYIGGTLLSLDGEPINRTIGLHLTRRGDKLHTLDPPDGSSPPDITLVWGRIGRKDIKRLRLLDPLRHYERNNLGDTMSDDGWYLNNRIGVVASDDVEVLSSGIYISKSLLQRGGARPFATYSSSGYLGGYSRHLPQYITLSN